MNNEVILFSAVFIPTLGSFLLPVFGAFSVKVRNAAALVFVMCALACAALLIPVVSSGSVISINYPMLLGINFILSADMLAVFMAVAVLIIGAVIVLYSFDYISYYENQNEYYLMVVLFLGSMMGLVFSGDLIFLFLFWEITTIVCWRLIGFFREKNQVLRADKAFLITVFGALMMLIGFVIIYNRTGSFDLAAIKAALKTDPVSNFAVFLILIGLFSKSATLPFHTWLPDAGVAPSPVTALLHAAVLVKIGVYVYARLFISTMNVDVMWHTVIPVAAGISTLVSAGAALVETDIKRIIAYSTISQIGFIFLGFSVGNEVGAAGALLYILTHGLAKGGLFLCAGIIEQNTGTKDIRKLGGLMKVMPVTALAFLFCAFSVMGIPPFGGFFGKYMVVRGAVEGGHPAVEYMFLAGAIMTVMYLLRAFTLVFLGELKIDSKKEGSALMVFSVSLLAALSLASGILVKYPLQFIHSAVLQMMGVPG